MSYSAGFSAPCDAIPDIAKDFAEPLVKKCLSCNNDKWTFTGDVTALSKCFNAAHSMSFNIFALLIATAISMFFALY